MLQLHYVVLIPMVHLKLVCKFPIARYMNLRDIIGKYGDMIVLAAPRWEHIVYQLVDPPIKYVIKKGKIVHSN
jgi:hypothetical protein